MRFVTDGGGGFLFLIFFYGHLANGCDDEDIKEMWSSDVLQICDNPEKHLAVGQLVSFEYWRGADVVKVEIRSFSPLLVRFLGFVGTATTIELTKLAREHELEKMNVTSENTSFRHKGRRADGLWLGHDSYLLIDLFEKIKRVFNFNPSAAESFLLLKYDRHGHYAPHYDYLEHAGNPDYWMAKHGNRLATMLLIAEKAKDGGGTVFPHLGVTVQPEPGDLVVWFNSDGQNSKEVNSIHGACPIKTGTKVALSLWIRSYPHPNLMSPMEGEHKSYRLDHILRF